MSLLVVDEVVGHFGDVLAIEFEFVNRHVNFPCDVLDGSELALACNFDVSLHVE